MKTKLLRMGLMACASAVVLSGCAAPSTLKALSELDQFCATDSGYEVFKRIESSACFFGTEDFPRNKLLVHSEYLEEFLGTTLRSTGRETYVRGNAASDAHVKKFEYELVDSTDGSVLGRAIDFCGGGPAHFVDAPGVRRCCPSKPRESLVRQVIRKSGSPCK